MVVASRGAESLCRQEKTGIACSCSESGWISTSHTLGAAAATGPAATAAGDTAIAADAVTSGPAAKPDPDASPVPASNAAAVAAAVSAALALESVLILNMRLIEFDSFGAEPVHLNLCRARLCASPHDKPHGHLRTFGGGAGAVCPQAAQCIPKVYALLNPVFPQPFEHAEAGVQVTSQLLLEDSLTALQSISMTSRCPGACSCS